MGMDRVVVTGDTAAVRETFRDGADIVLTPPGDADALAATITRLARDPALRERIGHAAGERVRREFSPTPLARRFVAICEETTSG
jgi:glycosyltransferase involved in cell wall biosynthesis